MAIPILIDTDIGDDIDDAFALALAAASPECDLVAITTVFQCAPLRARLAAHLMAALGRPDVPVLAGTDRPLLGSLRPEWAPNQASVLRGAPEPAVASGRAALRIVDEGLRSDGLVVAPIGAMTNVALALALEPALAQRVRVVAMAGAWDRDTPEWNVLCDPEAVAAVLASGVRVDFVGLDVTTRVRLRPADLDRLAGGGGRHGVLLPMLRAWQRASRQGDDFCPLLHDPLAVAAIFRPDLLVWEERDVSVELAPGPARAVTRTAGGGPDGAGWPPSGRVRVARDVDAAGFLDLFARRVCR